MNIKDVIVMKLYHSAQVVDDDGVVPGWEGKIVGWIEEDVGQKYLADDMA